MPKHLLLAALFLVPPSASPQQSCLIETFAGGVDETSGDGGLATESTLYFPFDGAIAEDGTVYFTDASVRAVRRIRPNGIIDTVLDRERDPSISTTTRIALSPDGSVLFQDNPRLRRILPDGSVVTLAGNGGFGSPPEGALAVDSPWMGSGFATGADGGIYFVETARHRVRRIAPDGHVSTVAGASERDERGRISGGFTGDGGPARQALFNQPQDVALGPGGSLYVADGLNRRIRRIRPDGVVETVVGGGNVNRPSLDGVPALDAYLVQPTRVEVDAQGQIYFTHSSSWIYRVDLSGIIHEVAQVGLSDSFFVGPDGTVVYLDRGQLFRISPEGVRSVIAGIESTGEPSQGDARQAWFSPYDLEFGPSGDLYIAAGPWILAVSPDRNLRWVAGSGGDFEFDQREGIDAKQTYLDSVFHIAVDREERVYFSERGFRRIRSVEPDGTVRLIAGRPNGGQCDFDEICGLGRPARDAYLVQPTDLYAAADGVRYFVDRYDDAETGDRTSRILRIDGNGTLSQTAPTLAKRDYDGRYDVFFAGPPGSSTPTYLFQFVTSVAATLPPFYQLMKDGSSVALPAPANYANPFDDAVVAGDGSIYFTTDDQRIRKVLPDGTVATIAGAANQRGFEGDGGPAHLARFGDPEGLALGADGALYIADSLNSRVRRILDVASCDDSPRPEVALRGILHAADFTEAGGEAFYGAAPGMILSIFGRRLGPDQALTAQVRAGRLVSELGGVRVLIDGVSAPLAFVSATQINAIVPYATKVRHQFDRDGFSIDLGDSRIEIDAQGIRSEALPIKTRATRPGIFLVEPGVSQRGAIVNQDGTLNGPANPAKVGSVVVLYATGEGDTNPPGVDGLLAVGALPRPVAPVTIRVGEVEATVLYAGAAPTFTAGLMQANARLESGTPAGQQQLALRIGGFETSAPIWVAP